MKKVLVSLMLLASCVTTPKKEIPNSFVVDSSTLQIVGLLTPKTMENLVAEVNSKPKDKPLNVYIHSNGGDLQTVTPLIEALQARNTTCLATMAGGLVMSLYQACTVRLVMDKSILARMSYGIFDTTQSKGLKEVIETLEELEQDATGKSKKEIDALEDGDRVIMLNASKAVSLGFADAVVPMGCSEASNTDTIDRVYGTQDDEMMFGLRMTQCPTTRKIVAVAPAELMEIPNGDQIINIFLNMIGIPFIAEEPESTPI